MTGARDEEHTVSDRDASGNDDGSTVADIGEFGLIERRSEERRVGKECLL